MTDNSARGPQRSLFDDGVQAWTFPQVSTPDKEHAAERQLLLLALANSPLATIEHRLAYVLQRHPETRNSHTHLAIQYWHRFQPEILEQWDGHSLDVLLALDNFETLCRMARHIQNDLAMYPGQERFRQFRELLQAQLSRYLAQQRTGDPEIRLYLDETGNDPQSAYRGVAGICVVEWRQYEKYHAVLDQWRGQQGAATLHFKEVGQDITKECALLDELNRRKAGLLFVGHAIRSRGATNATMFDLCVQLTLDCLRKLDDAGCLRAAKALTLIKEADDGFDKIYLGSLTSTLEEWLAGEFANRVYLKAVQAYPKGREVLLECADLIAGGMQRRALYSGRNPKDVLAEAVMNVTGFEDTREQCVVFRLWGSPAR